MSELYITVLSLPGSNPFWKAQLFAKLALNFKALKHLGDYRRPDILKWKKVELCVQERCLGIGWEFARFLRDCGESLCRATTLGRCRAPTYNSRPPGTHGVGPRCKQLQKDAPHHLQTEDGRGPYWRNFFGKFFLWALSLGLANNAIILRNFKKTLILQITIPRVTPKSPIHIHLCKVGLPTALKAF